MSDLKLIVAALANGLTPRELCASFIENDGTPSETFDPSWLMEPAYGEFARRGIMLPALVLQTAWQIASGRTSLLLSLSGRMRLSGNDRNGSLFASWGKLGVGIELHDDTHKLHLRKAREWYDSQPNLLK